MLGDSQIFTTGRLAVPVVFHLTGGDRALRGIFDETFFDPTIGEQHLETSLPRLTVTLAPGAGVSVADITGFLVPLNNPAGIARETRATINGKNYAVVQVQPDLGNRQAVITLALVP